MDRARMGLLLNIFTRSLLSLMLVLIAAAGWALDHGAQAHPAGSFVIDTLTDGNDTDYGDNLCNNGTGCGLRAAIQQAQSLSSAGDPMFITFDASLAGSTFYLDAMLGAINWAAWYVTLDGGTNNITISGEQLAYNQDMFIITGSSNTLTHLTIRDSNWNGIYISDAGSGGGNYNTLFEVNLIGHAGAAVRTCTSSTNGCSNNVINYSRIGILDPTASACTPGEENGTGIEIGGNGANNQVLNSYVVCSTGYGINSYNTSGTLVQYNHIGLGANGALPNGYHGIYDEASEDMTIDFNDISGNLWAGIWLSATQSSMITTNGIGVNFAYNGALGNHMSGIVLSNGATDNLIGGSADDRNTICGNTQYGIQLRDGAFTNVISYNYIGVHGSGPCPNGMAGISISNSNGNTIGTLSSVSSQFISNNTGEGIYIEDSSNTEILGDTDVTYNGREGIMLFGARNSQITPYSVRWNGLAGVAIEDSSVNTADGNLIFLLFGAYSNGGLAIDLGNDGHTPNGAHSGPGPNNWVGYPVITSVNGTVVSGTACANCQIDVYQASGDPAGNGGGALIYLVTTPANASGNWSLDLAPYSVTAEVVTLVATDGSNNSSEFSPLYGGGGSTQRIYLPMIVR